MSIRERIFTVGWLSRCGLALVLLMLAINLAGLGALTIPVWALALTMVVTAVLLVAGL